MEKVQDNGGWTRREDKFVNDNPHPDVGDIALGWKGYAFEIEWDGDCWSNIGGEEYTHWKPLTPPQ